MAMSGGGIETSGMETIGSWLDFAQTRPWTLPNVRARMLNPFALRTPALLAEDISASC